MKKILNFVQFLNEKKMKNPCWDGYKMVGTKIKNNKEVPNCVPVKDDKPLKDDKIEEFKKESWIIGESETDIIKLKLNEGKSSDVEKVKDGIIYRGENFPGFNKPKTYKGKGKFKKRVLAKEGDEIKVLNYGHKDYSDYTKHKDKERRKNFRARHKCDPVSNLSKLTKRYWACQDLW